MVRITSLLVISTACLLFAGCAAKGMSIANDGDIGNYLVDVELSAASSGACVFVNREQDRTLMPSLMTITTAKVLQAKFDSKSGEHVGLEAYLATREGREILISMAIAGEKCLEFEAYWVLP